MALDHMAQVLPYGFWFIDEELLLGFEVAEWPTKCADTAKVYAMAASRSTALRSK
jgi:hypothetical protein